jgi:ribosomal protein L22
MEAVAKLRHYRSAAQKVRLVADLIRMKPVGHALALLKATSKSCASDIFKVLESAVANAKQADGTLDEDALVVASIMVDGAGRKPLQQNMMVRSVSNYKKRFARPRFMSGPQGRMWLIPRPFCHVTVVVSDDPVVRKKAGLSAESAKPVARRGRGSRIGAAIAAAGARPARAGKKSAAPSEKAE